MVEIGLHRLGIELMLLKVGSPDAHHKSALIRPRNEEQRWKMKQIREISVDLTGTFERM